MTPSGGARGPDFLAFYETLVLAYVATLLFLYPYGVTLGGEASIRPPDLLALTAVGIGAAAVLVRGRVRFHAGIFGVVGAFLALELLMPCVGAVGYRKPADIASALRIATLWLPIVFLTMLAPARHAPRFEDRFARLLSATMWINAVYAVMQVAGVLGVLPRWLLVTTWLEPFTVDSNFKLIDGLRPSGFFANSTTLSVFGIVCLCLFYSRYVAGLAAADLRRSLLAAALVVLSTSRTAYIATALILFAGWLLLPGRRKAAFAFIVAASTAAMLVIVERTIGIDVAFSRIQRLAEVGVFADTSFGMRFYDIWPTAIEAARDYRFGTLVQPQRVVPLIDSGYLNYYLQGKWLFVASLVLLLAGLWFQGIRAFLGSALGRRDVVVLFLAVFLTGALVISNPMRSPLLVAFLVLSLWRVAADRAVRPVTVLLVAVAGMPVGLSRHPEPPARS